MNLPAIYNIPQNKYKKKKQNKNHKEKFTPTTYLHGACKSGKFVACFKLIHQADRNYRKDFNNNFNKQINPEIDNTHLSKLHVIFVIDSTIPKN